MHSDGFDDWFFFAFPTENQLLGEQLPSGWVLLLGVLRHSRCHALQVSQGSGHMYSIPPEDMFLAVKKGKDHHPEEAGFEVCYVCLSPPQWLLGECLISSLLGVESFLPFFTQGVRPSFRENGAFLDAFQAFQEKQ